uniref:C2H2-type domain-containing protein n=1 Tax=Clastoptera arizonana TaxID=38151 RepID=A0A1B6DRG3_9HEMI
MATSSNTEKKLNSNLSTGLKQDVKKIPRFRKKKEKSNVSKNSTNYLLLGNLKDECQDDEESHFKLSHLNPLNKEIINDSKISSSLLSDTEEDTTNSRFENQLLTLDYSKDLFQKYLSNVSFILKHYIGTPPYYFELSELDALQRQTMVLLEKLKSHTTVQNNSHASKVSISHEQAKIVFPENYLFCKKYFSTVDKVLECSMCNEMVKFESDCIIKHLQSPMHIEFENQLQYNYKSLMEFIKYNVPSLKNSNNTWFYICCLCDFITSNFYVWKNHLKAESENNIEKKLRSHFCQSCKIVLFGEKEIWKEHCSLNHINTDKTHLDQVENLEDMETKIIVPDNFVKCKVGNNLKRLTHEDFLNKVMYKSVKKMKNSDSELGFYCSFCNIYIFYNISNREHPLLHISCEDKNPVYCEKYVCKSCNVDLYGDEEIMKEHILTISHKSMLKCKDCKPKNVLYEDKTDDSLFLCNTFENLNTFSPRNVSPSSTSKESNVSLTNHDYDGSCADPSANKIKIHTEFIKLVLDNYEASVYKKDHARGFYCRICNEFGFYSPNEKRHDLLKHNDFIDVVAEVCPMYYCETCNVELYGPRKRLVKEHNKILHHQEISSKVMQDQLDHQPEKEPLKSNENSNKTLNKVEAIENDQPKQSIDAKRKHKPSVALHSDKNSNEIQQPFKDKNNQQCNADLKQNKKYDVIDNDSTHQEMMKSVIQAFITKTVKKFPEFNSYLCQPCEISTGHLKTWQKHIESKKHIENSTNANYKVCPHCRALMLCQDYYFNDHEQSKSHFLVCRKIELESSINSTEGNNGGGKKNNNASNASSKKTDIKKTDNKVKKQPQLVGVLIKGYPLDMKKGDFYAMFNRFGYRVKSVKMCFGDLNTTLVTFNRKSDVDRILSEQPIWVDDYELELTLYCENMEEPLSEIMLKILKTPDLLRQEVEKIIKDTKEISVEEEKKTKLLLSDISTSLENTSVYPFGSRIYGIFSKTSDLDVFVDLDNKMYYDDCLDGTTAKQDEIMKTVAKLLKNNRKLCIVRKVKARVPIIQMVHLPSKMACDLSFKNGLSVENTQLTKCYLEADPRVFWLVTAVKYWAESNNLKNSNRFTSYALIWMVMYFLMQLKQPVVFPVEALRKSHLPYDRNKRNITGWNCQFCLDVSKYPKTKNNSDVIKLLHEFFIFYSTLDCDNSVLCPVIGTMVEREKFNKCDLAPCFDSYVKRVEANNKNHMKLDSAICLQDPFDFGHNLTKSVTVPCLQFFKKLCAESAALCAKW